MKVPLSRLISLAKRVRDEYINDPSRDLASLIVEILFKEKSTDLREGHIQTLVHIINNLIYFSLIRLKKTTAVRFRPVKDSEVLNKLADYVRLIKDKLISEMNKEQEKSAEKVQKTGSDSEFLNEEEKIEYLKHTRNGKYIGEIPIECSDYWQIYMTAPQSEEKHFNDFIEQLKKQYKPILEFLEYLNIPIDIKQGERSIIITTQLVGRKLLSMKDELLAKLLENTHELYKLLDQGEKIINHVLSYNRAGNESDLDLLYSLALHKNPKLQSLSTENIDCPIEFRAPENDLINFDNFIGIIIERLKARGKLDQDYKLLYINELIRPYIVYNDRHPFWQLIDKFLILASKRLEILREANKLEQLIKFYQHSIGGSHVRGKNS